MKKAICLVVIIICLCMTLTFNEKREVTLSYSTVHYILWCLVSLTAALTKQLK